MPSEIITALLQTVVRVIKPTTVQQTSVVVKLVRSGGYKSIFRTKYLRYILLDFKHKSISFHRCLVSYNVNTSWRIIKSNPLTVLKHIKGVKTFYLPNFCQIIFWVQTLQLIKWIIWDKKSNENGPRGTCIYQDLASFSQKFACDLFYSFISYLSY